MHAQSCHKLGICPSMHTQIHCLGLGFAYHVLQSPFNMFHGDTWPLHFHLWIWQNWSRFVPLWWKASLSICPFNVTHLIVIRFVRFLSESIFGWISMDPWFFRVPLYTLWITWITHHIHGHGIQRYLFLPTFLIWLSLHIRLRDPYTFKSRISYSLFEEDSDSRAKDTVDQSVHSYLGSGKEFILMFLNVSQFHFFTVRRFKNHSLASSLDVVSDFMFFDCWGFIR